jgi:hypothetical protein
MRINRLATSALVAAALLTGCAGDDAPTAPTTPTLAVTEAGHNAADHFQIEMAVDFQIENPCLLGELIDFSGEETGQLTFVDTREHLDAGFFVHSEHQGRVTATGIGSETGATYTINTVFHESFDSPSPPAPQFTASFHERLRVTSSVSGLSFVIRRLIHVLATPTGGFKVTQDVETVKCQG